MTRRCRVAFLHPDLGLGGAERLVVDAAVELVRHGHTVDMYTAHYDPRRCFDETRSGDFAVVVAGSWWPRHVLRRFHALCAVARCVLAALFLAARVWSGSIPDYDVIVVDQVAAVVPLLKLLLPGTRVLFYCHFPDLLLATGRGSSWLKRAYRLPLDYLEERATGGADLVLVNSNFTAGVFADTFRRLAAAGVAPGVLYPAVAVPSQAELREAAEAWRAELDPELVALVDAGPVFLSINRFERKKGIGLALRALRELCDRRGAGAGAGAAATAAEGGNGKKGKNGRGASSGSGSGSGSGGSSKNGKNGGAAAAAGTAGTTGGAETGAAAGDDGDGGDGGGVADCPARLVIAGGYDARLAENREHLKELRELARRLGVARFVRFVPSFSDRQRALLLAACRAVVYTPQHEHFGIVPLEAMASARPVVAVNNGGPTESVLHGRTGQLCDPTPAAFAAAYELLLDEKAAAKMGAAARKHVVGTFSRTAFGDRLNDDVQALAA